MEKIATHSGVVTTVTPGHVSVTMQVQSACSACQAHSKCGFAEKADKSVEIDTPDWQRYSVGDSVTVVINTGRGMRAVAIAYALPALLLLACIITLSLCGLHELLVILSAFLLLGAYCLVLYRLRDRLQHRFTFRIVKA